MPRSRAPGLSRSTPSRNARAQAMRTAADRSQFRAGNGTSRVHGTRTGREGRTEFDGYEAHPRAQDSLPGGHGFTPNRLGALGVILQVLAVVQSGRGTVVTPHGGPGAPALARPRSAALRVFVRTDGTCRASRRVPCRTGTLPPAAEAVRQVLQHARLSDAVVVTDDPREADAVFVAEVSPERDGVVPADAALRLDTRPVQLPLSVQTPGSLRHTALSNSMVLLGAPAAAGGWLLHGDCASTVRSHSCEAGAPTGLGADDLTYLAKSGRSLRPSGAAGVRFDTAKHAFETVPPEPGTHRLTLGFYGKSCDAPLLGAFHPEGTADTAVRFGPEARPSRVGIHPEVQTLQLDLSAHVGRSALAVGGNATLIYPETREEAACPPGDIGAGDQLDLYPGRIVIHGRHPDLSFTLRGADWHALSRRSQVFLEAEGPFPDADPQAGRILWCRRGLPEGRWRLYPAPCASGDGAYNLRDNHAPPLPQPTLPQIAAGSPSPGPCDRAVALPLCEGVPPRPDADTPDASRDLRPLGALALLVPILAGLLRQQRQRRNPTDTHAAPAQPPAPLDEAAFRGLELGEAFDPGSTADAFSALVPILWAPGVTVETVRAHLVAVGIDPDAAAAWLFRAAKRAQANAFGPESPALLHTLCLGLAGLRPGTSVGEPLNGLFTDAAVHCEDTVLASLDQVQLLLAADTTLRELNEGGNPLHAILPLAVEAVTAQCYAHIAAEVWRTCTNSVHVASRAFAATGLSRTELTERHALRFHRGLTAATYGQALARLRRLDAAAYRGHLADSVLIRHVVGPARARLLAPVLEALGTVIGEASETIPPVLPPTPWTMDEAEAAFEAVDASQELPLHTAVEIVGAFLAALPVDTALVDRAGLVYDPRETLHTDGLVALARRIYLAPPEALEHAITLLLLERDGAGLLRNAIGAERARVGRAPEVLPD